VATTGSAPSSPPASRPRPLQPRRAEDQIEPPQHSVLSLGGTHIDERAHAALFVASPAAGCALRAGALHYGDPRGNRELRAAIADHLLSRADCAAIRPDHAASGTLHALRIVLGAILKPNDRSGARIPGYPAARRAIEIALSSGVVPARVGHGRQQGAAHPRQRRARPM